MKVTKSTVKKHVIEVRRYLPKQDQYGSQRIGKITGNYGQYEVVEKIRRALRSEAIGNFCPVFCTYKGNDRCQVQSASGDLSDPFRADESYLKTLFIIVK